MDPRHSLFALADPVFYDHPSRRRARRQRPLAAPPELEWSSWRCVDDGTWSYRAPNEMTLPDQGWKIHISAIPANAAEIVALTSTYCHANRIAFKHLPDLGAVIAQSGKDADRSASGKVITIYPIDEAALHRTLKELDARLSGMPGPWILSDLRWEDGPLSVRYGAFAPAWLRDDNGHKRHGLRGPDGELVEDRREPAFTPPPWVDLPGFLREQSDRLGDGAKPDGFAYDIIRPLAYSNAGGTYLARDRDGNQVVLKEARPHVGFTPDGRDATTRLRDEHSRLLAVAGTGVVAVRELFEVNGHVFLALDHVDGIALHRAMVAQTPTIRAGASTEDFLAYRRWALDVGDQAAAVLARIHAAGFTHGDLHPGNIMVTPERQVVLLDFEFSTPLHEYAPVEMGAPGFVPSDGRGGADADLYALACVKLSLFCPLTPVMHLDRAKVDELISYARDAYALPESWARKVAGALRPRSSRRQPPSWLAGRADTALRSWDVGSEPGISELMVMIGRSLAASADPSRGDRLWPGDPAQFGDGGHALAHGAAGVIHGLRSSGLEVDPIALAWFHHATDAALTDDGADPGLYDGLAGAAWVHRREGDDSRADHSVARLRATNLSRLGPDLYGGLPGIGLHFLSEVDRRPALLDDAVRLAVALQERHGARPVLTPGVPVDPLGPRGVGLMWGATGTALFALRLYERTGDPRHLELAITTLDYDLRHCVAVDDGSLHVDEGHRLMPYLASGSAGIGVVLAQLLPHLDDADLYRQALTAIIRAACTPFTIEAGVFNGRAGMMMFHIGLARLGLSTPESRAALDEHARALRLHAVRHATGIGFAGGGLMRLSSDLATGAAGVLAALNSYSLLAYDPQRAAESALPFLFPPAALPASAALAGLPTHEGR
ncbi:class III lanthionine synthetase LanKC [uncultured Microbacterium sp.]|uniref:class III lanthionine synthetase LanKC n=1 Tax=uncultured Microbacterium sp. TaxID=191216 RepID=UPI0035CC6FE1